MNHLEDQGPFHFAAFGNFLLALFVFALCWVIFGVIMKVCIKLFFLGWDFI